MYTDSIVTWFLKPVALCVLLLFWAVPAAQLACGWACAPQSAQPDSHQGHHSHSTQAVQAATADSAVRSSESPCDHSRAVVPALTSASVKVFAPVAVDVATVQYPDHRHADVVAVACATPSPPGARPGPRSLRI